jgi:flavodoxin
MAKGIIVYVTRTGNSRKLAEMTSRETGFPVHEIQDLVNRKGIFGWLNAGFQASTKKATPIQEEPVQLTDLDTIILVYPIWASSVCPPIRTWLNQHKDELRNKQFGVLVSNLGSPGERARAAFEREFYPLKAFEVIREKETETDKLSMIKNFVKLLGL